MLNLNNNIQGEKYNKLIEICFDVSTYFSLTKPTYQDMGSLYLNFLDEMSPYYIRTINSLHWFSYYVLPSNPLEVSIYHADKGAETIIKKYFDNIFQREPSKDGKWGHIKNLPEDLCFFYEKELFLGTVSHEKICFAYPPTEEIANQFKTLGDWEEVDYMPEEHIRIEI